MKWIYALGLFVALAGCAGGAPLMENGGPRPAGPPAGKALVWFVQPQVAREIVVWDGDRPIGALTSQSCFPYACPPGHRFFVVPGALSSGCRAELSVGKTYYLVPEARPDGLKARIVLVPATPGSEYAQKAPLWARELPCRSPNPSALAALGKSTDVSRILEWLRTDEGREQVTTLPPDAGR